MRKTKIILWILSVLVLFINIHSCNGETLSWGFMGTDDIDAWNHIYIICVCKFHRRGRVLTKDSLIFSRNLQFVL